MDYLKRYELWKNASLLEEEFEELENMTDEDIKDAFLKDLEFGTGGMRGIMGVGSNRMNIYTVSKAVRGYANYLLKYEKDAKKKGVVIGYDTRHNSQDFAKLAADIFSSYNIPVHLFSEFRPTPFTSYAILKLGAVGGFMFTASHNPPEYNGMKAYNSKGAQLNVPESEQAIEEIAKVTDIFNVNIKPNKKLIKEICEDFDNKYFQELVKVTYNETSKNIKILYSPVHATGISVMNKFFSKLGYDMEVFAPHGTVDPEFSFAVDTNPENIKAWEPLFQYAREKDNIYDLIIMTDPDADRASFAIKTAKGDYFLLNGNQQAAILLYYILDSKRKSNTLIQNNNVISTVVTTDLLKDIATDFKQNFIYTLTGFKFLAEAMDANGGNEKFTYACEESIGAIVAPYVRDKDAISLALLFSELVSLLKDNNRDIIDYYNKEIADKYGYYMEHTINIPLLGEEGAQTIKDFMNLLRDKGLEIKGHKLIQKLDFLSQEVKSPDNKVLDKINLPVSNVLKFYYDFGWIAFRPSGTEPKLKIYFSVVSKSAKESEKLMNVTMDTVRLVFKDFEKKRK